MDIDKRTVRYRTKDGIVKNKARPMRLLGFIAATDQFGSIAKLARAMSDLTGVCRSNTYISNYLNDPFRSIGIKELIAIARLLKLKDPLLLDEVYYPPGYKFPGGQVVPGRRGEGFFWIGSYGNRIRDYGEASNTWILSVEEDKFTPCDIHCDIFDEIEKLKFEGLSSPQYVDRFNLEQYENADRRLTIKEQIIDLEEYKRIDLLKNQFFKMIVDVMESSKYSEEAKKCIVEEYLDACNAIGYEPGILNLDYLEDQLPGLHCYDILYKQKFEPEVVYIDHTDYAEQYAQDLINEATNLVGTDAILDMLELGYDLSEMKMPSYTEEILEESVAEKVDNVKEMNFF